MTMSSITAFTSTSKSICNYLFIFVIHNNVTVDFRATTDISTAGMLGVSMAFTTPDIMTTATPDVNISTVSYLSSITINTGDVITTVITPHDSITPTLASATRTGMFTTTTASSGSSTTILDASTSDMSITTAISREDVITTTSSVSMTTTTSSVGMTNSTSGMPTGI